MMYCNRLVTVLCLLALAAFAGPLQAEEQGSNETFIEYVRIHTMIAGVDSRYVLRWWTDGRVEIRVPPYARNGGHHELQPGDYDIAGLEDVIARTERSQRSLQSINISQGQSRNRNGEIHQVHDADIVMVRTHQFSRAPVDIRIESPDHWNRMMPDDQGLAELADIDRVLMDWIQTHASL